MISVIVLVNSSWGISPLQKALRCSLQVFSQSVYTIRAQVISHIFEFERYFRSLNSENWFKFQRTSFDDESQGICCWECLQCFHVVSWSYGSCVFFISCLEGDPVGPSRSTKIPKFHDFEPFSGRRGNSDPPAPVVQKFSVIYPLVFNLHGIVIWSCIVISVKFQHDS